MKINSNVSAARRLLFSIQAFERDMTAFARNRRGHALSRDDRRFLTTRLLRVKEMVIAIDDDVARAENVFSRDTMQLLDASNSLHDSIVTLQRMLSTL